jgi:hypothetical protein
MSTLTLDVSQAIPFCPCRAEFSYQLKERTFSNLGYEAF